MWHIWGQQLGLQVVTLDHGEFSGKREIRVNGTLIYEKGSTVWDVGSKHKFSLVRNDVAHNVELEILPATFEKAWGYAVTLDGEPAHVHTERFFKDKCPTWFVQLEAGCAHCVFGKCANLSFGTWFDMRRRRRSQTCTFLQAS